MPIWLSAFLWGGLAGSALVIGAAVGFYARVPPRVIAAVMAFGSGVLISALAFELMDEAYRRGGFAATAVGFVAGAAVYTVVDYVISHRGAKHRKRSGDQQSTEEKSPGSGAAIAAGALLDGIPESIVIGLSLLVGGGVGWVAVVAIFLSNLPEGLSSSAGMKKAGRTARYVFTLWTAIALASAVASWSGYTIFSHFGPSVVAATTAVAAGAVLAMLADTMIPEAYETAHTATGLITAVGFLASYMLSKLG
jgi:ZIP family zinc transporter